MRLDFNVLWVDDQPEHVAAQITSVKSKMAAEGFDFKHRQCTTIAQMETAIAENVFTDEVDLILVDWDLGNNEHGDDAIERIRQIALYKNVVFYSGQATVVELQKKAYEKHLEGVYCASRAELVDEVIGVFESLIQKVLDLDHTRGIVMGATSDIDHIVISCLRLAHDKLNDAGKTDFINEVSKRVRDQVKNILKQGKKLRAEQGVDSLLASHMLFTSDHRLQLLANLLAKEAFAAHADSAAAIQSYRNGVVRDRNTLGHAVLVPDGKPNAVVTDSGAVINITQMRELRKLLLNLRADFRALLRAMQA